MSDDWREFQFRDGDYLVPPHLAAVMGSLDTFKYTYREAIEEANQQMVRNHVSAAIDRTIIGHFRGRR
jgi:hypothetical protein